ncbi:MAG: DUF2087 domain-containing protein [Rubrivivax sp.]|nr:DUF2087 domain-containing protein [Rubrivivax sp.]
MRPTASTADRLSALQALVARDGVGLGGLPAAQQSLALALVWSGLPAGAVVDEREVNLWLKAQLAGAAAFLDTDHVELRRWLVDAGWLWRDGYGREYRPMAVADLAAGQRMLAESVHAALGGLGTAAWVTEQRARHRARREARRREWQASRGPAA